MTVLVAKDLRLASGALRPLAVVVVGILLGTFGLSFLPAKTLPLTSDISAVEMARYVGGLVMLLAPVLAAWTTVSILSGDRLHRAAALAAMLPVSRAQRRSAAAVAMVAAAALVLGPSLALQRSLPGPVAALTVLWWLAGVVAGHHAARWAERPRGAAGRPFGPLATTLVAALSVAAVVVTCLVAAHLAALVECSRFAANGMSQFLSEWSVQRFQESGRIEGAIAGLCAATAAGLVLAAWPRRNGRALSILVVSIAVALTAMAGGAAGASWSIGHHGEYRVAARLREMQRSIQASTDDQLLFTLNSLLDTSWHPNPGVQESAWNQVGSAEGMVLREAAQRVLTADTATLERELAGSADGATSSAAAGNRLLATLLALATDPEQWAPQAWGNARCRFVQNSFLNRWDRVAMEVALRIAGQDRDRPAELRFDGEWVLQLLIVEEEEGIEQGWRAFNRLFATVPPEDRPQRLAEELASRAARGHRDAERLQALAAALRSFAVPDRPTFPKPPATPPALDAGEDTDDPNLPRPSAVDRRPEGQWRATR